jgi:enamine deaminase RidA (YjgF/YER057c/UK114 family)
VAITRLPGAHATRSRAVIHNGIVHAVATSPDKTPSMTQQTRLALAEVDRTLAEAGTTKARILSAIVYIADMAQKPLMTQAWDEWAALDNPPMRACIGATLAGDTLVEIVVTAALPDGA